MQEEQNVNFWRMIIDRVLLDSAFEDPTLKPIVQRYKEKRLNMQKIMIILFVCSSFGFAMEMNLEWVKYFYQNELALFVKDKNPQINEETGAEILKSLLNTKVCIPEVVFAPGYHFSHLALGANIKWKDDACRANDHAMLKRLMAYIIAQNHQTQQSLESLCIESFSLPDAFRWIVTGDDNSCVSDQRIEDRLKLFISRIKESILSAS